MMPQRHHIIPTILLLLALLLPAAHSDASSTGMAFLRMGVGARAAALGDAYVAVPGDGFASHWNPAGLAQVQRREFTAMHNEWAQGIRYEYGGLAWGAEHGAMSLGAALVHSGDLERRVGPSAEPLGTFSVYDLALSAGYARAVRDDLALGLVGKWLAEKVHADGASGFACDLGLLYAPPVDGLHLGLALRNLGKMGKLRGESINLPTDLWVGVSHQGEITASGIETLVTGDLRLPEDGERSVHAGVEVHPTAPLYLRVGYSTEDVRTFSAGFGLVRGGWTIDYAFVPLKQDLGNTHRISLRWTVCSGDDTSTGR